MCGIAGFIDPKHLLATDACISVLERMSGTLVHRGPDGSGHWHDAQAGVGLGHRRLSVIDISEAGRQPMHSHSGRYVVAFNGEIYNFRQLRQELESQASENLGGWNGHADTEVLLAAIETWGLEDSLNRFNGMFAFALWDRKERALHLVRDRLGEKPLYYGLSNNVFLFASELKALRAHPAWRGEVDRDALALLMRHNYIPAPHSIYRDIRKLVPGSVLSLPAAGNFACSQPWKIQSYWSLKEVAEAGSRNLFEGSDEEAVLHLETLLKDSVRLRMEADVPLGAFLSGGIDSSLTVAIMQELSSRPVKTFTIGFGEKKYNETEFARPIAEHLGTEHTEVYATPEKALQVIPRLPVIFDEPFADTSQISTFLVAELARRHVTVSLSGDGGDELFAGYSHYLWGQEIWRNVGWIPAEVRKSLAGWLCRLSSRVAHYKPPLQLGTLNFGSRLYKLSHVIDASSQDQAYLKLLSNWQDPAALVLDSKESSTIFTDRDQWAELTEMLQRMLFFDTAVYLPDDILVKVDRASMATGLEARVPFLDHRVVEFAWQLPPAMKMRGRQGKWIPRRLLGRYLPDGLFKRPKMGFGTPIGTWLRGPLREWGESLLDEKKLREGGMFNPGPIREKWTEHLAGQRNWQYHLWGVLMFQAWAEVQ